MNQKKEEPAGKVEAAVAKAIKKHQAFKSRADFDLALNTSTDENIIILDGETVKGGILPVIAFKTSPNGDIVPVAETPE